MPIKVTYQNPGLEYDENMVCEDILNMGMLPLEYWDNPTLWSIEISVLDPDNPVIYPIGSMYAIYGKIYHQYTPNVSIYTSTMDPMGMGKSH